MEKKFPPFLNIFLFIFCFHFCRFFLLLALCFIFSLLFFTLRKTKKPTQKILNNKKHKNFRGNFYLKRIKTRKRLTSENNPKLQKVFFLNQEKMNGTETVL